MGLITWKPRLETGHTKIDEQHRALTETFNQLHEAVTQGKAKAELSAALDALKNGTVAHFQMEEELMDRFGYPGVIEHKGIHGSLVSQMEELSLRFEEGRTDLTAPVLDFLEGWLLDHFQGEDVYLATFLKSRGNGL